MLSSNKAIQYQQDTIWDGVGLGALAGGGAGIGAAYLTAGKEKTLVKAATPDKTKNVFDQKGYDAALNSHQKRIENARSLGMELIEKSEKQWGAANSIQFDENGYRRNLTEEQKRKMQEHVWSAERSGDQSLRAMQKIEELEGVKFDKNNFQKQEIVKGNAAHYENKRKMSTKRGVIGAGIGIGAGALLGGVTDYYSR